MGKQNINDKEHILVCLSSAPSNPKIIQTAAAMAKQRRFPARIYGDFAQKKSNRPPIRRNIFKLTSASDTE